MKLFKKIINPQKYKSFISIFIFFFFINNLIAFGSENKSISLKSNNANEFEKAIFKNSIPYSSYDNSESQLEIFFGRWRYPNRSEKLLYPDLSIINDSDLLRQLYKSKLNDMVINENYNNK